MRLLRAAAASTPNGHAFRRHRLFTTSPSTYTPLLRIENAIIPGLQHRDPPHTFSWTINDAGAREAWAVTGPAAERGGAVKAEIVRALMGQTRLQQQTNATSEPTRHPKVHPLQITIDDDRSQPPTSRSPTFSLVSFSSRLSSISGGPASSPSSFVDFSTRYGAIRDEDRITLYESIMEAMGTKTGLIARRDLVHDPLVDGDVEAERDYAEGTLRLPWTSEAIEAATRRAAKLNHQRVLELAPLLRLNEGDPPLLHQPLISLSNGQTRRARILSALCASPDVLVLEEPFTGLDPPSRAFLSQLLAEWHGKKTPRIVCVLREQDELPDFVTHILKIGEQGEVLWQGEKRRDARLSSSSPPALTGAALVRQQASDPSAPGRGDESAVPVAALNNVTVAYKGHEVLKSVSLALPPGSRTILVGDNGSGKTTLLSLLTGSHPQSFSYDAPTLSLFGQARSASSNATPLLLSRIGQLSPELANAFPRKGIERGGLTVAEAVGTGFDGIFTRRPLSEQRRAEVRRLVERFAPVLAQRNATSHGGASPSPSSSLSALLATPFIALTPGSQILVLFLRAIVQRPTLLILDEPFQGMSAGQVEYVRGFLDAREDSPTRSGLTSEEKEEQRRWFARMAWVVVSHFEGEWPRTAARLLRLERGSVVERV